MCTSPLNVDISTSDELINYPDVDLTERSCGHPKKHEGGPSATLYLIESSDEAANKARYSDV